MRYKLISVGLIGINNHADRIRKIVEQSHGTRIDVVYHPKKNLITQNLVTTLAI